MDAVFFLDAETRSLFFKTIAQTNGCTYICLWSYVPLDRLLLSIDGYYNHDTYQLSSSAGRLSQILFSAYRQTQHTIEASSVPGLAFKEGIPYLELNELDLLRRTSYATQLQFYQEARIKSAAFLSCRSGEIEIGMSTSIPINMRMEINNWFQQWNQSQFKEQFPLLQQDQDWPSSSSSRSLSVGSPENSSLFFSMPSSTPYQLEFLKEVQTAQASRPTLSAVLPHQQEAMEAYNHLRIQNLNPEGDNAVMAKAILAVISSSSSNRHYTSALARNSSMKVNSGKENMFKRSGSITRNIHQSWREEDPTHNILPNSSQVHHKMSERKRREKLNDSFHELRSLLPRGSKKDQAKDKASVLSCTLEYLSNLRAEVMELKQKNELLEARTSGTNSEVVGDGSSSGKIDIEITQASESTSEEREIELRVIVRGEFNIIDLIIDILEYLRMVNEASLVSMNADTELLQTNTINRVIFRLKIQGSDWDEPAFQEAMARIVADVAN